eukprot:Lankesteria_metandrocarpae@DN3604_c0_g1_i1.p1
MTTMYDVVNNRKEALQVQQKKNIAIIGAPLNEGQGLKGVELGPDEIRSAGLLEIIELCSWTAKDCGNVTFEKPKGTSTDENVHSPASAKTATPQKDMDTPTNVVSEHTNSKGGYMKNYKYCGAATELLMNAVYREAAQDNFVLTLGGDHGIAGGTIPAMMKRYPDLAVIWVDAHADCNTPYTSPSGNFHGMPAAMCTGWFARGDDKWAGFDWLQDSPQLPEERLAFIGLRDIDSAEKKLLRKSKINCFSMKDVDRYGIGEIMRRAIQAVDPEGVRPIHVSFDIDACDPSIAKATGTLAQGGLTYRESHYILETAFETNRLVSLDMVEVNPSLEDVHGRMMGYGGPPKGWSMHGDRIQTGQAVATARLAVDLIGSALGTTIL